MADVASAVVLLAVLGGLAVLAAGLDAQFAAAAAGRPAGAGAAIAPLRSAARLLVGQRRTTLAPDALLWRVAGGGLLVVAALASVVTPLGGHAVADLGVGLVWWNAMEALLWGLVWLAGWGANGLLSLVGGYRFLAQALAYELPLMFVLTTPAIAAGSLRVSDVVAAQQGLWFVVWMPVAFVAYLACALALCFWGPFDQPVQADLAGGVDADLAGVDRLVFAAGRYALLAATAAFAVPLFLGGGAGPVLPGWLWSLAKTVAVLALLVGLRWRLPTLRMDRVESLAWLVLVPATLLQALAVSIAVLLR